MCLDTLEIHYCYFVPASPRFLHLGAIMFSGVREDSEHLIKKKLANGGHILLGVRVE